LGANVHFALKSIRPNRFPIEFPFQLPFGFLENNFQRGPYMRFEKMSALGGAVFLSDLHIAESPNRCEVTSGDIVLLGKSRECGDDFVPCIKNQGSFFRALVRD
jgi:hypothetical protein